MKHKTGLFFLALVPLLFAPSFPAPAQETGQTPSPPEEKALTLTRAAVCEEIHDLAPKNEGVVFSTARGKIVCFTAFDPVPNRMFVYHQWYRRDEPIARVRLTLNPPRWSTYSTIQLRESDKGPWRVEIRGKAGRVYGVLRFSITD